MRGHGRGLDGRRRSSAAGTGKAASCGGWGVAYEARGYKQGWADGRAGKTGKPMAQIEPKSCVAEFWLDVSNDCI